MFGLFTSELILFVAFWEQSSVYISCILIGASTLALVSGLLVFTQQSRDFVFTTHQSYQA